MKSIINLIGHLKTHDRVREYDAFNIVDDNIKKLEDRIKNLEKKNMRYYVRAEFVPNVVIPDAGLFIAFTNSIYPQFGNMYDNGGVNVTIRRDGVYYIDAAATCYWNGTGTGGTLIQILLGMTRNGVQQWIGWDRIIFDNGTPIPFMGYILNTNCSYYCRIGDIIKLFIIPAGSAGNAWTLLGTADSGIGVPYLCVSERMEDLNPSEYGLMDPSANMR